MAEEFYRAMAKTVIGQLCEATKFSSIQNSSLDTLTDVLLRYIEEIGQISHAYTEHAGRTETNLHDMLLAFEDVGVVPEELSNYVELTEELPFAHPLSKVPRLSATRAREVPTFREMGEAVPKESIPDWLPAFPDVHTTEEDADWPERKTSPRSEHLELDKERRRTEGSLVALHRRLKAVTAGVSADQVVTTDSSVHKRGKRKMLWGQQDNEHTASGFPDANMYVDSSRVLRQEAPSTSADDPVQEETQKAERKGVPEGSLKQELGDKVLDTFSSLINRTKKRERQEEDAWTGWARPEAQVKRESMGVSFEWTLKGGKKAEKVQRFFAVGGKVARGKGGAEGSRKKASAPKFAEEEKDDRRKRFEQIMANAEKAQEDED